MITGLTTTCYAGGVHILACIVTSTTPLYVYNACVRVNYVYNMYYDPCSRLLYLYLSREGYSGKVYLPVVYYMRVPYMISSPAYLTILTKPSLVLCMRVVQFT